MSNKKIRVNGGQSVKSEMAQFFESLARQFKPAPLTSGLIRPSRKKRRRKNRVYGGAPAGTKMARACLATSKRGFDGTMRR